MIQAKLAEMFLTAVFKHPEIKALFKYKDEPNECDMAIKKLDRLTLDLEKKITDTAFKVTAAVDLIKPALEAIDTFQDKFKEIEKITKGSSIPLKEINEIKQMQDEFKGIKKYFEKMKKLPLLKSVFK